MMQQPARTPDPDAFAWSGAMERALVDERHSPASRLLWLWLWDHTGRRGGRLMVSTKMMAAAVGLTARAVDSAVATGQCLPKGAYPRLVALGLVDEVARDPDGTITIYVNGPNDKLPRAMVPDPQKEFAFSPDGATDRSPETDWTSADAPTSPTVPIEHPASLSGAGSVLRAHEVPSRAITIERFKKLNPNHEPCAMDQGGFLEDQGASVLRAPEVPSKPAADSRAFGRLVDELRRRQRIVEADQGTQQRPVASAIVEAIDRKMSPERVAANERRIVELIEREIGTEGTDPAQPWIAAEAIVEHGVPEVELHKTIAFAKRTYADGKARKGLAACFWGTLIKVFARKGFHWPKRPKPR